MQKDCQPNEELVSVPQRDNVCKRYVKSILRMCLFCKRLTLPSLGAIFGVSLQQPSSIRHNITIRHVSLPFPRRNLLSSHSIEAAPSKSLILFLSLISASIYPVVLSRYNISALREKIERKGC